MREIKLLEEINDDNDIKRHLLQIHTQTLKKVLSEDLLLGVLDEKDQKFISSNIESAFEALHRIQDKEEAQYACNRLLLKALSVANLKRNVKDNPLATLVVPGRELDRSDENLDLDESLLEKMKGKDRRK